MVQSWDDMEVLWRHMFFNELKIDPTAYPVIITEAPLNPKKNREQMMATMFDTFDVPAFSSAPPAFRARGRLNRLAELVRHFLQPGEPLAKGHRRRDHWGDEADPDHEPAEEDLRVQVTRVGVVFGVVV